MSSSYSRPESWLSANTHRPRLLIFYLTISLPPQKVPLSDNSDDIIVCDLWSAPTSSVKNPGYAYAQNCGQFADDEVDTQNVMHLAQKLWYLTFKIIIKS